MRILVCGDRDWEDAVLIHRALKSLLPGLKAVVHGDCKGADRLAGEAASRLGLEVSPVPAQWGKFGRAAGPIRNSVMLKENPEIRLVLAFHDNLEASRGTADMIKKALRAGKLVRHWFHGENGRSCVRFIFPRESAREAANVKNADPC
jgi:hypothetical protein